MIVPIRHSLAAFFLTIACLPTALYAQAPNITATKSDGTAATAKKNPGDTVTYTNVITNAAGAGAATGTGASATAVPPCFDRNASAVSGAGC